MTVRNMFREFLWPRSRAAKIRMAVAAALLVVVAIGGCGHGDRAFYWPSDKWYNDPADHGLAYENVTFNSPDGTPLHAWFLPAQPGPPVGTVIYFHGNAQNLTAHFQAVSYMPGEQFNVFIFDYRGFGKSEGTPSRQGIHEDCVAALDYIATRQDVDPARLVAFGQSLGGACGLAAIGETDPRRVRGIAVESTFGNYRAVAAANMAMRPQTWLLQPLVWWLVSDGHDPLDTVDRLAGTPLLVIHGDADEIVAFSQGRELFEAMPKPKRFIRHAGGGHVEATSGYPSPEREKFRAELIQFFRDCLQDD